MMHRFVHWQVLSIFINLYASASHRKYWWNASTQEGGRCIISAGKWYHREMHPPGPSSGRSQQTVLRVNRLKCMKPCRTNSPESNYWKEHSNASSPPCARSGVGGYSPRLTKEWPGEETSRLPQQQPNSLFRNHADENSSFNRLSSSYGVSFRTDVYRLQISSCVINRPYGPWRWWWWWIAPAINHPETPRALCKTWPFHSISCKTASFSFWLVKSIEVVRADTKAHVETLSLDKKCLTNPLYLLHALNPTREERLSASQKSAVSAKLRIGRRTRLPVPLSTRPACLLAYLWVVPERITSKLSAEKVTRVQG